MKTTCRDGHHMIDAGHKAGACNNAKGTQRDVLEGFRSLDLKFRLVGQSPELMDAYHRANELFDEGRYQEAIPFAKEALRLSEREFGPDDSTTGSTLNNLAFLYRAQGRYAEAEPLYKRSLAIKEKAPRNRSSQ